MSPLQWTYWIVIGLLDLPIFFLIGKFFFNDWDGLVECIVYWFTPDIVSACQGERGADFWASLKLGLFLAVCGAVVFGEYRLFLRWFG